jgi:DNA invertase Pin-like site-specific DNA recombinase
MIYGYIRVSTEKQTVEVQRYEINRYCSEQGIEVDAWIEESISGAIKPSARLLGKLILDRIKKGDLILVTEISRLGRNVYMVMSIINHCMLTGAAILPIWKGEIIKEDSMSVYETFFDIISAQKERELISRRTKCALAMMKSNGVRLGRPVGIPRKRKLEGKEKEIIRLLSNGVSKAEVSRRLGVNQSTLSEFIKVKQLWF